MVENTVKNADSAMYSNGIILWSKIYQTPQDEASHQRNIFHSVKETKNFPSQGK